jgi:acetyl esterase/lipase/lysophospholipase L1-like esterase
MNKLYVLFFLSISMGDLLKVTKAQSNGDAVTSLCCVKESYKLSGLSLKNLSEKFLYKKTIQGDMYLFLLRPNNHTVKALPAIIYFTGGGWINGEVEYQIPNAAWFRDNGIIGITADYRVKSRHGTTPMECIEDAKSAVRYVRVHSKDLGINPDKIIVAGGSAGGHIAACTFLEGGDAPGEDLKISTKPNALVLHNPVLGEGTGEYFFKDHPEFSPILNVKNGWPPTILSNGTKDVTTPYYVAEKFTGAMKNSGNICELITVNDADHSCDWPVSNPDFLPTLIEMTQFLVRENFIVKNNVLFQSIAPKSLFPPKGYAPDYIIDWSKNHYREKIAEFQQTPIGPDKIVMVGNSLTEGAKDWAKRLDNITVINRGISGDVTEGVLKRIDEICFYNPKAIFLLIGINDINGGNKLPAETIQSILKIVDKIHTQSPKTKVYVQTLLPTSFSKLQTAVEEINKGLKANEKVRNYKLVDIHTAFADNQDLLKKELTTDGVHLTEAGYQLWSSLIRKYIPKKM